MLRECHLPLNSTFRGMEILQGYTLCVRVHGPCMCTRSSVIISHGDARDDAGQVGRQEQRRVADVVVVEVLQQYRFEWTRSGRGWVDGWRGFSRRCFVKE